MNSPKLLLEVLELKLQLTLCDPRDVAPIQAEIDKKQDEIRLLSKVPIHMVRAVCDSRYPEFVAEQIRDGKIIKAGS